MLFNITVITSDDITLCEWIGLTADEADDIYWRVHEAMPHALILMSCTR